MLHKKYISLAHLYEFFSSGMLNNDVVVREFLKLFMTNVDLLNGGVRIDLYKRIKEIEDERKAIEDNSQ